MPNDFEQGIIKKNTLIKLVNEMSLFEDGVTTELRNLLRNTEELSYVWKDPQFKQFEEYMFDLVLALKKELDYVKDEKIELEYIISHL